METLNYDPKCWKKPCPKIECKKDKCKCGLAYVNIPSVLGDDSPSSAVAPKKGAYCNAIVEYEANKHVYIYSKEGIPVLVDKNESCSCEEEIINLSVVIDEDSWGPQSLAYSIGDNAAVGVATLSAAQGNQGLFVNDDSGEFVTEEEAYELIASGKKVKFNHVPVGQRLVSPHVYGLGPEYVNGIELTNEYVVNIDGAPVSIYSATVSFELHTSESGNFPPLGVFLQKIEGEPDNPDYVIDDAYAFMVQGRYVENAP